MGGGKGDGGDRIVWEGKGEREESIVGEKGEIMGGISIIG